MSVIGNWKVQDIQNSLCLSLAQFISSLQWHSDSDSFTHCQPLCL